MDFEKGQALYESFANERKVREPGYEFEPWSDLAIRWQCLFAYMAKQVDRIEELERQVRELNPGPSPIAPTQGFKPGDKVCISEKAASLSYTPEMAGEVCTLGELSSIDIDVSRGVAWTIADGPFLGCWVTEEGLTLVKE